MKKENGIWMKFPDQMQGKVFSGLILKSFWIIILINAMDINIRGAHIMVVNCQTEYFKLNLTWKNFGQDFLIPLTSM